MKNRVDKIKQRLIYADILKIVAIIAVIIIHVTVPLVYQYYTINLSWWWIGNIFDSATRWGVPIFVMVSGVLLLGSNKEKTIKIFLTKILNRILIPFIFWGIVYTIWKYRLDIIGGQKLPLLEIIKSFISGPIYFHLWYIYMILGLYIITPIIRIYIKNSDSNNLKYFLILWFITNGVFNFIGQTTGIKIGIDLNFFLGFIGYYVLGYYLHITKFNKKQNYFFYSLSIIGFIMTILGTFIVIKNNNGILNEIFYSYLSPNVIFMSIGVFILFKNYNWNNAFENGNVILKQININNIVELSSLSFGIYLVHALVLELISLSILPIRINAMFIHPLFGIPFTVLITLLLSICILKFLKRFYFSKNVC